jgi:L-alanine-DL-glutamate epimerase-like enolase superfamily enzyme
MAALDVEARSEIWPLKEAFTISRGSKTSAHVVVAIVRDGAFEGRGEAVPYDRYGETVAGVLEQIRNAAQQVSTRSELARFLKPGAAMNALDCAFWDLESKRSGVSVAALAGLPQPVPAITAFTLSLGDPQAMAKKASEAKNLPLLKLKLGGTGDDARMRAVRQARPDARLIVDANEAWRPGNLPDLMTVASQCGIEMIEQPLPAGDDESLRGCHRTVPVCADESVHTAADLPGLAGLYDAVNVKLDKAGGLTGAIALVREARQRHLKVMIGSMVATSLAVAPAMLLASQADWIDLDGPLLLARDRDPALRIRAGCISPPDPELWG